MLLSDKGNLLIWTVYDHPTDMPDYFVARAHEVDAEHADGVPTDKVIVSKSLTHLRTELQLLGLTKLDRYPEDLPHIIETWL